MKSTKKARQVPEPMHTMLRRYDEIEKQFPRIYKKPAYLPQGIVERAAHAVAAWDLSDPFAYSRAALYLRQGYIDPKETEESYHLRTVARRVARVREVEAQKNG